MKIYIRHIAKKLFLWSQQTTETLISFLSCLIFSSFSAGKELKRIRKDIVKQGKECYILGNGPALQEALSYMRNKKGTDFFVVNMFANQPVFFDLKPNNYIIIDSAIWNKIDHPAFSTQKDVDNLAVAIKNLCENLRKVDWPMNLFVPAHCPTSFTKKLSPLVKVVRINTVPVKGFLGTSHFLYRTGLGMPQPMNVTNAAVYVAIMLKYSKTYLYGVNHSWLCDYRVDEENRIYTEDSHFYKNANDRYYIKKGALAKSLQSMAVAFNSHTALEEFSRTMGVRVYNRTKGSFIDAYEFDC